MDPHKSLIGGSEGGELKLPRRRMQLQTTEKDPMDAKEEVGRELEGREGERRVGEEKEVV